MGCTPSILSTDRNQNRKDSGLFCANFGSNSRRIESQNILNGNQYETQENTSIRNQMLVNSFGKSDNNSGEAIDKVS